MIRQRFAPVPRQFSCPVAQKAQLGEASVGAALSRARRILPEKSGSHSRVARRVLFGRKGSVSIVALSRTGIVWADREMTVSLIAKASISIRRKQFSASSGLHTVLPVDSAGS